MKLILDTNTLIYAFQPESRFYTWSRKLLSVSISRQEAYVNPVILSELCVGDRDPETVIFRIRELGIQLLDITPEVAPIAATKYAKYLEMRKSNISSAPSKIPLPDFFIGAQALLLNFKIATVDIQRYGAYFSEVPLLTPEI